MKKSENTLVGIASAIFILCSANQSFAALITEWSYEVQSGFTSFAPAAPDQSAPPNTSNNDGVVGSDPNVELGALPTVLSWGEGSNGPSQLLVTPTINNPPNLFTNAGSAPGAGITHGDTLTTGKSLSQASVAVVLDLNPISPAGSLISSVPTVFLIAFDVTENAGVGGLCIPGQNDGFCTDVFILEDPSAQSFDFLIDEFIYTVEILLAGLSPLTDEACAAAGEIAGCIGFVTAEGQFTTLSTEFVISARAVAVPEAATVALFVFGLLGLCVTCRRKRAPTY